ncbi:MAG: cell wall-binding repeat-containing protein, partial [Actinomycetota bacterium]|nr:cell wall-binding repeat-containing protein [Actinomycetota bacterium]
LAKLGPITRVWGRDRYATAAEISKATFSAGADIAYVAVGTDYPDALVGAPIVAGREGPLLLTRGDTLDKYARQELARLGPDEIVVVGGGGIISNSVVAQLRDLAPKVTSVTDSNRYATAIEVSRHGFPSGAHTVFVAIGTKYPDALAGGPPAADAPAPILLVPETYLPSSVAAELVRLDPDRVVILGGPAAVSSAVESAIAALFK